MRGRGDVRALIVGDGPEGSRLKALVSDLSLQGSVEFRASVPYDEMPSLYARASCLVLASLPVRYWEEQFGMVLAEAMAGHLPIVASASGAIPEVAGPDAHYVGAGDWVGLANTLERGPLAGAPGMRHAPPQERLTRFSTDAAAERLGAIYGELLGQSSTTRRDG
jgi:glycosyltransferase involved in cell wall biosynthesis